MAKKSDLDSAVEAAVATPAARAPRVSVIERRLAAPSVFRAGSVQIPLKDPSWTLRWENAEIAPDHLYRVLHELGWTYAAPADLDCPVEEIGAYERDNKIVRGQRGTEVLLKMRTRDYARVSARKPRKSRGRPLGKRL